MGVPFRAHSRTNKKSSRMPSFLSTSLLVMSLALLPMPAAMPAGTQVAAQATSAGPSVVVVPLEETLEVRPAAGWSFLDCGTLLAASELVTACTAESFTVTGPAYDAEIPQVRVPVEMRGPGGNYTVDYVIRLAEPTPASAPDTKVGIPVPSGSVALIPLSSLGIDCGLCTVGNATIEVGALDRLDLGVASVTGSHLVFSAAPGVQGAVEIDVRVNDDIETTSNTFKVTLYVSQAPTEAFHGLHLVRALEEQELEVSELLLEPEEDVYISSCGPAMHGAVRCTPSGSIRYSPHANTETYPSDQFQVHIVAADGRQGLASVTLLDAGSGISPAAGTTRAKLDFTLPEPPSEEDEETAAGVTDTFAALMDTLGAR